MANPSHQIILNSIFSDNNIFFKSIFKVRPNELAKLNLNTNKV